MRDPRRYFPEVVQILRGPIGDEGVGTDDYGEPLAQATPETITLDARIDRHARRIMDSSGQERIDEDLVFLAVYYPDPATGNPVELTIGAQDRIVYDGREHPVSEILPMIGWSWLHDPGSHWEVFVR